MSVLLKLFGFATGSIAQYAAIAAIVAGVYFYNNHTIKEAAFEAGQNEVIKKTQKVQNERIKKARRAGNRARTRRVRTKREPYQRD